MKDFPPNLNDNFTTDKNWDNEPNLKINAALALNICQTDYAFIFLNEHKNFILKSKKEDNIQLESADLSNLFTETENDFLEISDLKDSLHAEQLNSFSRRFSNIRYFATHPLKYKKEIVGYVGVMNVETKTLSQNQKEGLKLVADQVSTILLEHTEKDVKQKKQFILSEQKLKTFFENSQGLMCTHDLEGNFITVNDAGAKILGYSKKDLLTLSLYDIIPVDRHSFLKDYFDDINQKGKSKGKMITQNKNGKKSVWLYNNVLEKDLNGENYVIGNAVDITEQFKLENDLKYTTDILQQTNTVARVGGWELDVEKQTVYWTSMTKKIHGVPQDYKPNLQDGLLFYKAGESRDTLTNAINTSIKTGKSWDLELQIINNFKKELWVRTIINCELVEGKCVRLYGTFQDINEKKKAELEMERAKKLLDDVLCAASEVSIIATNRAGTITVFNEGAQRLLQYSAREMIGKSMLLIHEKLEIATYAEVLSVEIGEQISGFEVITIKAEKQEVERKEWTYIKKDGSRLTVSLVVTPIKDENKITTGYLGIATDITLKKKTELDLELQRARLQAFITHSPAAVAMFDNDMKYIAVSQKWMEDYKLQGMQVIGISHYELFPNLSKERKERHRMVLNGAVQHKNEDSFEDPRSHKFHYITWEMRPWYTLENKIGGMMIFTQDITSIIRQREELKKAKILAEQASSAKSEFLANISHEIRTPLNGVIGFTDLTLSTDLSEIQQRYLTIINQSGQTLLNIVNDILDFSRMEAGMLELNLEKINIKDLAQLVINVSSAKVATEKVKMLIHLSENLPEFVWADHVRLKQVLINLLGNAAKFTSIGEIELKIEKISSELNSDLIRFSVRDTGIGVKLEMQEKIFEAFAQEDSSTTKKYGGTGLGLTISNKLLKMMDSELYLQSEPGKGSTFSFDIKSDHLT
jgi:PAS domain S-box-containing protein